jgi:hypothetical protein
MYKLFSPALADTSMNMPPGFDRHLYEYAIAASYVR